LHLDFRAIAQDGSIRWVACNAELWREENGKPLHLVGVSVDITSRVEAENVLRKQAEELREVINQRDRQRLNSNRRCAPAARSSLT